MVSSFKSVLQAIVGGEMPAKEVMLQEALLRLEVTVSTDIYVLQTRVPGPCFQDAQHKIKAGDLCIRDERGGFMADDRYCVRCGAALLLELGAGKRRPFFVTGLDEAGELVDVKPRTKKKIVKAN